MEGNLQGVDRVPHVLTSNERMLVSGFFEIIIIQIITRNYKETETIPAVNNAVWQDFCFQ